MIIMCAKCDPFLIKNKNKHGVGNTLPCSLVHFHQWIRCLFDPWIRYPGWEEIKIRELRNNFCLKKRYLNPLMRIRIRDLESF